MKSVYLYEKFLNISRKLNQKLKISPVLYGSLRLEEVTGLECSPQDIDILVPVRFIKNEWQTLKETIESLGYTLVDLHEHKFINENFETGFSFEEDLWQFAGVNYEDFKRASKDGYRRTKNNNKDIKKIEILENL